MVSERMLLQTIAVTWLAVVTNAQVAVPGMSVPQKPDEDLLLKMNWLARDFAHLNSGADAEVDLSCSTSWCQSQFKASFKPAVLNPYAGEAVIDPTKSELYQSVLATYRCKHNPYFDIACRSDQQTIKSTGVTETHSKTTSFSGAVGSSTKIKGNAYEVAWEVLYNMQYQICKQNMQVSPQHRTSGKSESTVEGETTVFSVEVPMKANDTQPRCTVIQVVAGRVRERGKVEVGLSMDGTVAIKQDKARTWKYVDPAGSTGTQYRLFTMRDLVVRAKQYNLHRARDFVTENNQLKCVTTMDLSFDVAATGWATPYRFPVGDPRCESGDPGAPA